MTIHKKHTRHKDQFIDKDGPNECTATDIKSSVDLKHTQNTDTILTIDGMAALIDAGTLKANLLADDAINIQIDEIRARDGDGLKLYDDGGNGIFIEDGGNIGIGTADPEWLLDVDGDLAGKKIIMNRGAVQSPYIMKGAGLPSKGMSFYTVDNHRMIITEAGNVGIGANAYPSQKLTVDGNIYVGSEDKIIASQLEISCIEDGVATIHTTSGNTINITNNVGTMARFIATGPVELYDNGDKHFETTNAGARVLGDLEVTGTVDGVDIAAHNHSNGSGETRLAVKDRRQFATGEKHAADSAAGDTLSEHIVLQAQDALTVTKIFFLPDAALTANDIDYARITVYRRDSSGGTQSMMATVESITGDSGNWTAFDAVDFGAIAMPPQNKVAAGEVLTWEITKVASGVIVPAGTLQIEYTID